MSKWKCEICGSEFDNFHAQGFDNKIYCPLCFFKKENQELKKQNKKYKETIDKAINNCNNTLNYINNTILKNNIKVELNELLKIKGGLDTILESLVEEVK